MSDVRYATIGWLSGYRFGSDGTVWSDLRRDGSMAYVSSGAWRQKKATINGSGYPTVMVRSVQRSVHRLILEAFIGPCPEGMEACHNDGNRSNCSLANLRWDTRSNNHADKVKHGTHSRGSNSKLAKLNWGDVRAIRERRANGETLRAIALSFGISIGNVSWIVSGKTWRAIA